MATTSPHAVVSPGVEKESNENNTHEDEASSDKGQETSTPSKVHDDIQVQSKFEICDTHVKCTLNPIPLYWGWVKTIHNFEGCPCNSVDDKDIVVVDRDENPNEAPSFGLYYSSLSRYSS